MSAQIALSSPIQFMCNILNKYKNAKQISYNSQKSHLQALVSMNFVTYNVFTFQLLSLEVLSS
jgi:hypothetical protein